MKLLNLINNIFFDTDLDYTGEFDDDEEKPDKERKIPDGCLIDPDDFEYFDPEDFPNPDDDEGNEDHW